MLPKGWKGFDMDSLGLKRIDKGTLGLIEIENHSGSAHFWQPVYNTREAALTPTIEKRSGSAYLQQIRSTLL